MIDGFYCVLSFCKSFCSTSCCIYWIYIYSDSPTDICTHTHKCFLVFCILSILSSFLLIINILCVPLCIYTKPIIKNWVVNGGCIENCNKIPTPVFNQFDPNIFFYVILWCFNRILISNSEKLVDLACSYIEFERIFHFMVKKKQTVSFKWVSESVFCFVSVPHTHMLKPCLAR